MPKRSCLLSKPRNLPRAFFLPPPDTVARALLGKRLERRLGQETLLGRIVETEAYFGADDPAAHAFAGRTARNDVLFGPAGHAYVYRIYGLHACLNVSCEPEGTAGCVLVRALEPLEDLPTMHQLRGLPATAPAKLLTSGPGRLCAAFGITREGLNGADLLDPVSELQLLESEPEYAPSEIAVTRRVGITKAADRLLRFSLAGNSFVSGARFKS